MTTAMVEVAEMAPKSPIKSFQQAGMMHEVRDVYNQGTTLNSVAGDVHYHTYADRQSQLERPHIPLPPSGQSELPSQRYSRILMKKGRGYPLMDASLPNELPEDYQMQGVMIGDVGIVTQDGYYDVFFNICEDADGPINGGWVPEGFIKLKRPPDIRHNYRRGKSCKPGGWVVGADTVQVVSHPLMSGTPSDAYQFDCGPGEGGVLALPSGASKEDLIHCKDFIEYASRHGVSWYDFAKNRLGRDITNGSIYLITGYDKTRAWGTASFLTTSRFGMVFSNSEWKEPGQSSVKEGSSCQSNGGVENQCVFLRGYKVTLSNRVLAKIFGISVAEVSPMDKLAPELEQWRIFSLFMANQGFPSMVPSMLTRAGASTTIEAVSNSHPESPSVITATVPPLSPLIHPSNLVNLYLLNKFPDCDLAITHDFVWCSFLKADPEQECEDLSLKSLLEHIDAKYVPTQESGAIYLEHHLQQEGTQAEVDSLTVRTSDPRPIDSEDSTIPNIILGIEHRDSAPKDEAHLKEDTMTETRLDNLTGKDSESNEGDSGLHRESARGMLQYPVHRPPLSLSIPPMVDADWDEDDDENYGMMTWEGAHRSIPALIMGLNDGGGSVVPGPPERNVKPNQKWKPFDLNRNRIIGMESPTSTKLNEELESDVLSIASGSTGVSNTSSMGSVSTTATSVSSGSSRRVRTQSVAVAGPQLPRNIKIMTGVPWELESLPRGLHPNSPFGDALGQPPTRKKKPQDTKLGAISERPRTDAAHQAVAGQGSSSSRNSGPVRRSVPTSTADDSGSAGDEGEVGGVKKVQKGQINQLAKMLSVLRR